MARVLINENTLKSLGEVVRGKTENNTKLTPSQLVTEIKNNLYGVKLINETDYNNLAEKKNMLYLIPANSVGSSTDKKYRTIPGSVDVTVTCDDIDNGIFINNYFDKSIDVLTVTAGNSSVFNSPQDISNGKYLDVKKIVLDNKITNIGSGAFDSLTRLEEVDLHINYANKKTFQYEYNYWSNGNYYTGSDNVELYTFNTGTFNGCNSLYKVTVYDDSNIDGLPPMAFKNHNSLVEFESKKSYFIILEEAFYGCSNLCYVKGNLSFRYGYHTGQDDVAKRVFTGCKRLKYISAFNEDYYTAAYCEKIPFDNSFEGCDSLTNVNLDTYTIAPYLFKDCKNLMTVTTNASKIGTCAFENLKTLVSVTITGSGSIDNDAFKGCTNLTTVNLSNSHLTEINSGAFMNCTKLKNLNLSLSTLSNIYTYGSDVTPFRNSGLEKVNLTDANITTLADYLFKDTSSLTELKLPAVLTKIGSDVFYNSGLTTLTLPNTVNTLGEGAFRNSNLQTINWGNVNITTMGSRVFENTKIKNFVVPSALSTLGDYCFRNSLLETITIHDSITEIPTGCFYSCSYLTDVNLTSNNSLDIINDNAFIYCTSLTELDFTKFKVSIIRTSAFSNSGITELDFSKITKALSINNSAFSNCKSLTTVNLNSSYSLSMASNMFSGCTNLSSITFPSSATNLNISNATSIFEGCTGLQSVTINTPFTTLPTSMFKNCTNLESIELPDTLTSIPSSMFYGCTKLNEVTTPTNSTTLGLPTNLTSIGSEAFFNTALSGVIDIPSTITTNIKAFRGCTNITKITIRKPTGGSVLYPSAANYAFSGCTNLTEVRLYIPEGYKSFTFIPASCFANCASLTKVYLPSTITNIKDNAFSGCTSLTDIYFEGTEAQWQAITKSATGNSALTNATIHYEIV